MCADACRRRRDAWEIAARIRRVRRLGGKHLRGRFLVECTSVGGVFLREHREHEADNGERERGPECFFHVDDWENGLSDSNFCLELELCGKKQSVHDDVHAFLA
jgi:hypothetical protein